MESLEKKTGYRRCFDMIDLRKPAWLQRKIVFDQNRATAGLLNGLKLHTVCEEALCPNISECFKDKQATFLILGKHCTRSCRFCNVENLRPEPIDADEPKRVAQAVRALGLRHAVITSVTRDDLPDGGASVFCRTVEEIRKISPPVSVELLIPDFQGKTEALRRVAASRPDVIGHNVETVPRLYGLRPEADYMRSLFVLKHIKACGGNILTKSALMLGLGEEETEVTDVLRDLRNAGCDLLALGQYLRPTLKNTEVREYISPQVFERLKAEACGLGFLRVQSGPYVRSSYHAAAYLTTDAVAGQG